MQHFEKLLLTQDLPALFKELWSELAVAVQNRKHPWHLLTLSTIRNNYPTSRTVVLRAVSESIGSIACHTDIRSAKLEDFKHNQNISWLGYNPEAKMQIRILGKMTIHNKDSIAKERWELSNSSSRLCYATKNAPTKVLNSYSELIENNCLKGDFLDEIAFENFTVLNSSVNTIEFLYLKHNGHIRAQYELINNNWQGEWLAP